MMFGTSQSICVDVRLLAQHAVDAQPDAPLCQMARGRGRMAASGAEQSNPLAASQGWPRVLGGVLQIAPGQVVAGGVAEYVTPAPARRLDVAPAAAERHDQLDLVVQVGGAPADRATAAPLATTASAGFMKKIGGSRSGSAPISRTWSA